MAAFLCGVYAGALMVLGVVYLIIEYITKDRAEEPENWNDYQ